MSNWPAGSLHHQCPSPAELLQHLIRFDTTNPPGNERECVAYINEVLENAGCQTTLLGRSRQRPNLIARLRGQGAAAPLMLHGHVDVVTTSNQLWHQPPFEARLVDGCVWGRGALDMKGGIAMMLSALLRAKAEGIALPGDVVLVLVCDEEAGGEFGARFLVENHGDLLRKVRYAVGEFGGFSFPLGRKRFYPIMVAEKQICWLRATIKGMGGHASLDQRGGAMARLARTLARMERRRLPPHLTPVTGRMIRAIASNLPAPMALVFRLLLNPSLTNTALDLMGPRGRPFAPLFHNTVNPTIVQGGEQINMTPTQVVLELDGRLLPGYAPDILMAELGEVVGPDIELELVRHDPGPPETDMGLFDILAGILRRADPQGVPIPGLLPAATDARFFSRLGIQTYGFLPMLLPRGFNLAQMVHGPDERIPVAALDFGSEAMYQLMQRFGDG